MAWAGWFTYGGQEIVNATRTETYANAAGLGWFHPVYRNTALPMILDETYVSPLIDDAPWTDPDDLSSYDFYGAYPLDVHGIEDSTVGGEIVESTRDGGVVQGVRHSTKTVVFSVALVGGSEDAVEYGIRWLKAVLNGCGCMVHTGAGCSGQDLTYLSSEPAVDLNFSSGVAVYERVPIDGDSAGGWPTPTLVNGGDSTRPGSQLVNGGSAEVDQTTVVETAPTFDLTDCLDPYLRTLHKATVTSGPSVTAKSELSGGSEVWIVEWTVVAGDPYEYGATTPIVKGFLNPAVTVPYPDVPVPPGAVWDSYGFVTTEPSCPVAVFSPVFDPDCPLLVPPPAVPTINPTCFLFPNNYTRRMFTIPKQDVPLWSGTIPIITVHTPTAEVRNLRFQFFDDVNGDAAIEAPCDPQADVVFTYLPPNSTVTFDAVAHLIYVDTPGLVRRRAESVATNSDGGPFEWPELSCGSGYVVAVDMEQTQALPVIDLSLVRKAC